TVRVGDLLQVPQQRGLEVEHAGQILVPGHALRVESVLEVVLVGGDDREPVVAPLLGGGLERGEVELRHPCHGPSNVGGGHFALRSASLRSSWRMYSLRVSDPRMRSTARMPAWVRRTWRMWVRFGVTRASWAGGCHTRLDGIRHDVELNAGLQGRGVQP